MKKVGDAIDLNDTFAFDNISRKNYNSEDGLDTELALKDMERVMIFTYVPYIFYLKSKMDRKFRLEAKSEQEVMRMLKSIVIGSEEIRIPTGKKTFKTVTNKVTLKSLFDDGEGENANKNRFLVKGIRFISDDPEEFSYFRGWPWKPIINPDYKIIQPWLDHVKNNICAKNEDIYNHVINLIAFIVQNPGKKTTVAPLIIGGQGCGKGDFFAVPLVKLFGKYALPNTTKMETIIGKYNSLTEHKVFIVCNEMQDEKNAKYLNNDDLKSFITEYDIEYESKYVNKREGENVANPWFFSNHDLPIRLENDDRRYFVIKASRVLCKLGKINFEYFSKLDKVVKNELFTETLGTYLLQERKLDEFNPRDFPMTEAKEDMIHASKKSWQLFFEENIEQFVNGNKGDGYISKDCYANYRLYCTEGGYIPFSLVKFGMKIKRFVDIIPRKRNAKVVRYYKINAEGMKLYNILQKELEGLEEEQSVIECKKKNEESLKDVKIALGVNDKNDKTYIDSDDDWVIEPLDDD
jgi:hypothetical protein